MTFVPPFPEPIHPRIAEIYAHWLTLAPPGRLPGRQHFDPIRIPHLLPSLWLTEIERDPLRFRYRLIGTRIVRAVGMDRTGAYLDEAHPNFYETSAYTALKAIMEDAQPRWRKGRAELSRAHDDVVRLERIYLPLARDGRTVDMVLCCAVYTLVGGQEL